MIAITILLLFICNATYDFYVENLESPLKVDAENGNVILEKIPIFTNDYRRQPHGRERLDYFRKHCNFQFISMLDVVDKGSLFGIFTCKSTFSVTDLPGDFQISFKASAGVWTFFEYESSPAQTLHIVFLKCIKNIPLKVRHALKDFILCQTSECTQYVSLIYRFQDEFLIRRKTETGAIIFQPSSRQTWIYEIFSQKPPKCALNVQPGFTIRQKETLEILEVTHNLIMMQQWLPRALKYRDFSL